MLPKEMQGVHRHNLPTTRVWLETGKNGSTETRVLKRVSVSSVRNVLPQAPVPCRNPPAPSHTIDQTLNCILSVMPKNQEMDSHPFTHLYKLCDLVMVSFKKGLCILRCFACLYVRACNAHCGQKRTSELLVPDDCESLWRCRDDNIVSQSQKVRTLLGVYTMAFWSVHLRTANTPSRLLLEDLT